MEELIEEYKSSLEDLKFNSKPHINMLTILAEENKQQAEYIVRIIEERIAKAAVRLPILYLLDSIVKNVGGNYKALFSKKLNTTFKLAFEAANDKEKMSLYKLRTTWDDHFPLKKLHSLDLTIQALDPNWPVKPLPANLQTNATKNIHVNPKFLKTNESGSSSTASTKATAKTAPKSAASSNAPANEMDLIKQQLVKQQQQLLDLQQKKLLLELEQTKSQLAAKQKEVLKSKEKVLRDPRSHQPTSAAPGNLRVTLSNSKASTPAGRQASDVVKDPRLKSVSKKVSPEVLKTTSKVVTAKKKKSPEKKERNSPDIALNKNKTSKPSVVKPHPEKKSDGVIKKPKKTVSEEIANGNNLVSSEVEHRKKRAHRGKSSVSPQPPPAKILKRTSPPRRPTETLMAPTSKVRHEPPSDPRRNRMDRNRRVNALKDQSKDSSRSSDGSLSPRFSPEPDTDDVMISKSPERMRINRRNDALMRRPSFDPDLHIPQELTLGHQNEILRQANHQLNSGQLTHEQHQELLKQLHQLFEVQRMKKMQGVEGMPPHNNPIMRERGRSPVDPRQLKKRTRIPQQSAELERSRRPGRDQVPEDFHGVHRPIPEKRKLPMERIRKGGDPRNRVANLPSDDRKFHPDQPLPPPKRRNRCPDVPHVVRHSLPPPNMAGNHSAMHGGSRPFPRPPLRGPHRQDSDQPPRLSPPFPHDMSDTRHDPRHNPPRMSPPRFCPSGDEGRSQNRMADDGNQKNLRRFAHADAQTNNTARLHRGGDPRRIPRGPKDEPNQPARPAIIPNVNASKKSTLEEPEDYIIANIPPHEEDAENKLEEPEDFIIAEMNTAIQKRKESCEEPEDFIIAEMPFSAESCNHSTGVKRTTESEQAYLEHMKKIKQSMYTKEREANKRSSLSDNAVTTEGSSSEKSSAENETVSKKDEVSKSPSLPLKKRRYISSEKSAATETPKVPEPVLPSKDSSLKVSKKPGKEDNSENKYIEPTKPVEYGVLAKSEPKAESVVPDEKRSDKKTVIPEQKKLDKKPAMPDQAKSDKKPAMPDQAKSDKKLASPVQAKLDKKPAMPDQAKSDKKPAMPDKAKFDKKPAIPDQAKFDKKPAIPDQAKSDKKSIISAEKKSDKKSPILDTKKSAKKSEKSQKEKKRSDKESQEPVVQKSDLAPHRDGKPNTEPKTIEQINNDKSSLIYVIEDEEQASGDTKRSEQDGEKMRRRRLRPKEWRREEENEEARLQMLMEDEKKQLEWEDMLQRELEREQWKEDRMRRGQLGRGRGVRMPPERWESPPRDMQEPVPFDIARGRLPRDRPQRPRPLRHDVGPPRRDRPFPRDEMRAHHPTDDMRRPPSPGEFRGPPPPGWNRRRLSPPPRHHIREERLPEWDRPMGRLPPPPREPPYLPDDHRPPVDEYHPPVREAPLVAPAINQLNVNKLLTDLVVMGIIPGSKKADSKSSSPVPSQPAPEPTKSSNDSPPAPKVEAVASPAAVGKAETRSVSPFIEEDLMMLDPDARIPTVSLTSDLKKRHEEIVKRIYTGIQCSACGLRFTTRQTDLYADHLDWHYRANKKDKDGSALFHREFYPSAGDWITYEEIENPQGRVKSVFLEDKEDGEAEPLNGNTAENDLTVPLTGKPGEDKCKVCNEAFETFYNETDDEWQFARCVKVDGENFHPNCYGDHCELTPLPIAMQTPLYNPVDGGDGIPGLDTSVKEELENADESEKEEKAEDSADAEVIPEDTASVPDTADATPKEEEEVKESAQEDLVEKNAMQTSLHDCAEEGDGLTPGGHSPTEEEIPPTEEEIPETIVESEEEQKKDATEVIAEDTTSVPDTADATPEEEEEGSAPEHLVEKVKTSDVVVVGESDSSVKSEDVSTEDVAPKDVLTTTNDVLMLDDVNTT